MNRSRWVFAMVAALVLGMGCSEEPTSSSPRAGTLSVRLTRPQPDDGAMLFEVSGAAIDSVLAVDPSLRLFTRRVNGSRVVGAVVGAVANGPVVTLRVPDVGLAAGYTARVLDVADSQDALRVSLTGYALRVGP